MLQSETSYRAVRDAVPAGAKVLEAHACGTSIALLVQSDEFDQVERGIVPDLHPVIECAPDRKTFRVRGSTLIH